MKYECKECGFKYEAEDKKKFCEECGAESPFTEIKEEIMKTIKITEDTRIPGTNYILEAGEEISYRYYEQDEDGNTTDLEDPSFKEEVAEKAKKKETDDSDEDEKEKDSEEPVEEGKKKKETDDSDSEDDEEKDDMEETEDSENKDDDEKEEKKKKESVNISKNIEEYSNYLEENLDKEDKTISPKIESRKKINVILTEDMILPDGTQLKKGQVIEMYPGEDDEMMYASDTETDEIMTDPNQVWVDPIPSAPMNMDMDPDYEEMDDPYMLDIPEEFQIPGTDFIVEAGDRIQIISAKK
jgi:hypothetical protein